jgi:hypothetical protein
MQAGRKAGRTCRIQAGNKRDSKQGGLQMGQKAERQKTIAALRSDSSSSPLLVVSLHTVVGSSGNSSGATPQSPKKFDSVVSFVVFGRSHTQLLL